MFTQLFRHAVARICSASFERLSAVRCPFGIWVPRVYVTRYFCVSFCFAMRAYVYLCIKVHCGTPTFDLFWRCANLHSSAPFRALGPIFEIQVSTWILLNQAVTPLPRRCLMEVAVLSYKQMVCVVFPHSKSVPTYSNHTYFFSPAMSLDFDSIPSTPSSGMSSDVGVGLSNPQLSPGRRRMLDLVNRLHSTGSKESILFGVILF